VHGVCYLKNAMTSLSDSQNIDLTPGGGPVLPPGSPLQICPACEALLDTTDREPLERIACPQCGAELTVTAQIAHYHLLEVAGRGGMGVVYKAYDPSLDRNVAIKLLRKDQSSDQKLIAQLENEAAITASVTDPNVVRVYGSGFDRARFFLVMELVDKGSLDTLIGLQGRVAEAQVLQVGIQAARGLKAAQQHGLIHRDVKPGNILFADAHTAKIVDFGLAVFQEQEESVRGEVWGTPYYVAPEKLDQQPEDFRSDMYSLGGTLFHALAGRPPFEAESASLVALKHLKSQPVSLQTYAPWVSNATAQIINRMLMKDPNKRFQSYDDVIESFDYALQQLHKKGGADASKTRVKLESDEDQKKYTWVFLAVAAVVLLIGGSLGYSSWKSAKAKTAVRAAVRTGPRYEPLQPGIEAFAAGKKEAVELFGKAATTPELSPKDRAWAQLFEGAALLSEGKVPQARAEFAQIGAMAGQIKEEAMRQLLITMASNVATDKTFPVDEAKKLDTTGHEAAALLLYALHDWHVGKPDEAIQLFKQFRSVDPNGTAEWIGQFKPVSQRYVEKENAFRLGMDRLKGAQNIADRSSAADSLRKLDPVYDSRIAQAVAPYLTDIAKYKIEVAKPPTYGVFRIVNKNSGKVLEIPDSSTAVGVQPRTAETGLFTRQFWRIGTVDQELAKFAAVNSSKVIEVAPDGTKVQQVDDKNLPPQKWRIVSMGDGLFKIRHEASGKVLAPADAERKTGIDIVVKPDSDAPELLWQFNRVAQPVWSLNGHTIGNVKTDFQFKDDIFKIRCNNGDINGRGDNFAYAYREQGGNFEFIAKITEVLEPNNAWKAGLLIRTGLNGDDAYIGLILQSDGQLCFQRRQKRGWDTITDRQPNRKAPQFLKIERIAERVNGYISADGTTWEAFGTDFIPDMKGRVLLGLAVAGRVPDKDSTLKIENVKVTGK